ncbi:MAG: dephospho-CoA kinase [Verrucomicrobia bacterium]|jgi:dephospho-CoA kinase|nr:MAG: dephospho-CoA kinase [Verrucomicrobiota bacterium]PYJ33614.1 MAG: dephospho-CoA kinase [Verrucomicrobiota bacterium]
MPSIGITGGISTGKSTFCECLREIFPAAKFFNADQAAHTLVQLPEVKQEIRAEFGAGVFSRNGDLNRETLRAIIFADATKKRALERILHPRIRRQWRAEAKRHRNSPDFFFADIPLLYETGGEAFCDRVVVVACSYKVQLARLTQRMSLKNTEAEQMIKSQMPLDDKIARANHVVWNDCSRAALMEQAHFLAALWEQQSWTKR